MIKNFTPRDESRGYKMRYNRLKRFQLIICICSKDKSRGYKMRGNRLKRNTSFPWNKVILAKLLCFCQFTTGNPDYIFQ